MERQIEIMKSMGCNAILTSHNMAAPELLELCDRIVNFVNPYLLSDLAVCADLAMVECFTAGIKAG